MGGCCYSCLKYMVMIFNLLYMLLGLALVGTTLWMHFDEVYFTQVTQDVEGYSFVIFFFMAVGAVMTVMGFLGCCGAFQESQGMLATFFALVLVLFAGQLAAGFWLYQNHSQFAKVVEKSVSQSIREEYGQPGKEIQTKAFNVIQEKFHCCGSSGPKDWANSKYNGADDGMIDIGVLGGQLGIYSVPESCCNYRLSDEACKTIRKVSAVPLIADQIYQKGCTAEVIKTIKQYDYIIFSVVFSILLVELLAMIFSMVLCCAVRRIDQFKA